ncbi:hypothetical protein I8J29_10190 [Paenibacillus sp. MWE-103]|uniref:Uncharacterized protein n=1 Tax=Paenibacillus artemisiicola TaxID=1172618 RepID=A0ABS3W8E7_9BACL|nr:MULTISPECIES: hypothetical protein [Paenibacillus]MBO7744567.1 hypothetical protein [Paenibacillus artemisiicola]SFJ68670.1 hypothetical protein SAMN02799624_05492 [Paenibacillus sp. UNC496MF]
MKVTIIHAEMTHDRENGYRGTVQFEAEGHKHPYEISLQLNSLRGTTWDYSLRFAKESGSEEQIGEVEAAIEADDELFDRLIDAAADTLPDDIEDGEA